MEEVRKREAVLVWHLDVELSRPEDAYAVASERASRIRESVSQMISASC